jgi:zinc transporter ZupT
VRHGWLLLFLLLFVLFYAAILYSTTQPVGAFMSAPYLPTATNFDFAVTYGFVGSLLAAGIASLVLRVLYVGLKRIFS